MTNRTFSVCRQADSGGVIRFFRVTQTTTTVVCVQGWDPDNEDDCAEAEARTGRRGVVAVQQAAKQEAASVAIGRFALFHTSMGVGDKRPANPDDVELGLSVEPYGVYVPPPASAGPTRESTGAGK